MQLNRFAKVLGWLLVALSFAGVVDTLLISVSTHLEEQVCMQGKSCQEVLASRYAEVGGVSLWKIGFVFYCFLFATSLAIVFAEARLAIQLTFLGGGLGVLCSCYFVYLQWAKIGAWCPLCVVSAGLQVGIFVCAFFLVRQGVGRRWGRGSLVGTYVLTSVICVLALYGSKVLWQKVEGKKSDATLVATISGEEFHSDAHPDLLEMSYSLESRVWQEYQSWFEGYLIQKEAASQGYVKRAPFINAELAKVRRPIMEENLRTFYETEYRSTEGERLSFEETKDDIRHHLENQQYFTFERNLIDRLKVKHQASFALARPLPPILEMVIDPAEVPILGDPSAPIKIVQFADFACPYCRRMQVELRSVQEAYPEQVAIVYRHYSLPNHKYANRAAKASIAAWKQGKFWEYIEILYEKQGHGIALDETYQEVAQELSLDLERFNMDRKGAEGDLVLKRDTEEAKRCHVTAPPKVFINGHRMIENPHRDAVIQKMRSLKLIE